MNFGPPLRPHRNHFFLGLDLGKSADQSALVVLERTLVPTGAFDHVNYLPETTVRLAVRYARLFPLHYPYIDIPNAIARILPRLDPASYAAASAPKTLSVDATGVGAPVVELLRRARLDARVMPLTITSGLEPHSDHVPRTTLLSNLRILFETGLLRLSPGLPHAHQLSTELMSLSTITRARHDDLAFALALAAWPAGPTLLASTPPSTGSNRRHAPRGSP